MEKVGFAGYRGKVLRFSYEPGQILVLVQQQRRNSRRLLASVRGRRGSRSAFGEERRKGIPVGH